MNNRNTEAANPNYAWILPLGHVPVEGVDEALLSDPDIETAARAWYVVATGHEPDCVMALEPGFVHVVTREEAPYGAAAPWGLREIVMRREADGKWSFVVKGGGWCRTAWVLKELLGLQRHPCEETEIR